MKPEQKVVVITGASQGLGSDLVRAYRDRSYRVIANSRSTRATDDVDVFAVSGDIGQSETAARIVREGLEHFGRIDSLVNNAGVFVAKPFVDLTRDDYDINMSVNVAGFFHITQRLIPVMLKQGSGHVVTITTSIVDKPIAGVPAALAALTKGGLNAATKGSPRNNRIRTVARTQE